MYSPVVENIILILKFLSKNASAPKYLQLAEAIITTIIHTPLQADTAIPSSRTLCNALGWHRKTIIAAQHEVEIQGYIYSIPNKGFYVSKHLSAQQHKKSKSLHLDLQLSNQSKTPIILKQNFKIHQPNIPNNINNTYHASQLKGSFSFKNSIAFQKISNSIYQTKAFQLQLQHECYLIAQYQKEILHQWIQSILPASYSIENFFWNTSPIDTLNNLCKQLWQQGDAVFISPNCPMYAIQALHGLQLKPILIPIKNNKLNYESILKTLVQNKKNIKGFIISEGHSLPYLNDLTIIEKIQLLQAAEQYKIPILEIAHHDTNWNNNHFINLDEYGCSILVKDWNFYLPIQQSLVVVMASKNIVQNMERLFTWNNTPINSICISTIVSMIQSKKWSTLIKKTNKQLLRIQAHFIKKFFQNIHIDKDNSIYFNFINPSMLQLALQKSKAIGFIIHPDNIISNEYYHGIKYYFTEDNFEILHQYFTTLYNELIIPFSKNRSN